MKGPIAPKGYHTLRIYLIATAFALAALFLALQVTRHLGFNNINRDKLDWYLGYAFNVLDGKGYHDCVFELETYKCVPDSPVVDYAEVTPGYPAFLMGALTLFGTDEFLAEIQLLQCVLAAMIMFMTVCFAARWGHSAAIGAGVCLLTSYSLYYHAALLMTEIVFTFSLLVFVLLWLRSQRPSALVLVGGVLGYAMMVKGVLLLTLPLFRWITGWRNLGYVLLIPMVVIALWALRNFLVLDAFVPFTTDSGDLLWGSNNDRAYHSGPGTWISVKWFPEEASSLENLSEVERDQYLRAEALKFIRHTPPDLMITVLVFKFLAWFGLYDALYWRGPVLIWFAIWLWIFWRSRRRRGNPAFWLRQQLRLLWNDRAVRLMLILLAGALINALVFWSNYRFRFPFEPYLAVLTGIGISLLRRSSDVHAG